MQTNTSKKTGIITFHRAHNYGAVLQCYALQKTLQQLGYDVQIVDYRQSYIENNYSIFSFKKLYKLKRSPKRIIAYIREIPKRIRRKKLFENFVKKRLETSSPVINEVPLLYDRYIIGSDQLWSTNYTGGLDSIYWGNFPINEHSKKFTYAICSNFKSLNNLNDEELLFYLNQFDGLSFREQIIADEIYKRTGVKGTNCVDPVLLTNSVFWSPLMNKKYSKEKYIAIYQIHAPHDDFKTVVDIASKIAAQNNWYVLDLTPKLHSPEDFVSIIAQAQMVLTTSFHATVFSILFEVPFYTIKVNDTVDARVCNLLSSLDLLEKHRSKDDELPIYTADFARALSILKSLRTESINYLNHIYNEDSNCNT